MAQGDLVLFHVNSTLVYTYEESENLKALNFSERLGQIDPGNITLNFKTRIAAKDTSNIVMFKGDIN